MIVDRTNFECVFWYTFPNILHIHLNHDLDHVEYPKLRHLCQHFFVQNFENDSNALQPVTTIRMREKKYGVNELVRK